MRKQLLFRLFAIMALFVGLTAFIFPLVPGNKDFPTEKFSKLSISLKSTVNIEQGDNYKLDIQANENDLENIEVKYNGNELQIKCKNNSKIKDEVIINITTPVLNEISVAGSSEIFIEKTFKTDKMDLNLAGSGKMKLNDLVTDKVSTSIAGSGDIFLSGGKTGSTQKISIAGSGKYDATGFETAKTDVDIAGSGDCYVFAMENLNVSIAGSGNVYYKGKPQVNSKTAGSGKVKESGID